MKPRVFLTAIILLAALTARPWGQKGHDVTAAIAERHLTPTARAAVDSLLDGRSLVYWANWLDNASHTPEYAYSSTWHYINVDPEYTYDNAPRNPKGDIVTAIRLNCDILSDTLKPKEERALALKMLEHLMGDLHMPLHCGYAKDLGGNRVKVSYFGSEKNLHSVWDSSLPESAHRWSYSEWQEQIDRATPAEEAAIVAGDVDSWTRETLDLARQVYQYFPEGKRVSYDEVAYWTPTVEQQWLRGGLRLAHLLNTLLDPAYK